MSYEDDLLVSRAVLEHYILVFTSVLGQKVDVHVGVLFQLVRLDHDVSCGPEGAVDARRGHLDPCMG